MKHIASQKRQNSTNSPTASQPVRLGTPDPPLMVWSWDLDLGMQTRGLDTIKCTKKG